jgi:hypothetical protein
MFRDTISEVDALLQFVQLIVKDISSDQQNKLLYLIHTEGILQTL